MFSVSLPSSFVMFPSCFVFPGDKGAGFRVAFRLFPLKPTLWPSMAIQFSTVNGEREISISEPSKKFLPGPQPSQKKEGTSTH